MHHDVSALFDGAGEIEQQLHDFHQFRSRVIIRNDFARMGVLLLGIGVIASLMNGIVVASQTGPTLPAIVAGWLSVTASSTLFTVLFRVLAVAAIIGLGGGTILSIYAPIHQRRRYRTVHADFCRRGWVTCGASTGLSVDDDNVWIKRPVQVIVWSAQAHSNKSQWEKDVTAIQKDFESAQNRMVANLLLENRKFHGCITVRQLRSQYSKPKGGRGPSYLGFGPLHRMKALDSHAVIAPTSSEAAREPEPWHNLLFWIRR